MFDREKYLREKENLEDNINDMIMKFAEENGVILIGTKFIKDKHAVDLLNKIELKFGM